MIPVLGEEIDSRPVCHKDNPCLTGLRVLGYVLFVVGNIVKGQIESLWFIEIDVQEKIVVHKRSGALDMSQACLPHGHLSAFPREKCMGDFPVRTDLRRQKAGQGPGKPSVRQTGLPRSPFLCHIRGGCINTKALICVTFLKTRPTLSFFVAPFGICRFHRIFHRLKNAQTSLRGHGITAQKSTRTCLRIPFSCGFPPGKAVPLPCACSDPAAFVLRLRTHFQGQACSAPALQHERGSGKFCPASSL